MAMTAAVVAESTAAETVEAQVAATETEIAGVARAASWAQVGVVGKAEYSGRAAAAMAVATAAERAVIEVVTGVAQAALLEEGLAKGKGATWA